jgi:hypothetical protein
MRACNRRYLRGCEIEFKRTRDRTDLRDLRAATPARFGSPTFGQSCHREVASPA